MCSISIRKLILRCVYDVFSCGSFPPFAASRVCTQVDIRCTESEAIVTKARNLVAAYTRVRKRQPSPIYAALAMKIYRFWCGVFGTLALLLVFNDVCKQSVPKGQPKSSSLILLRQIRCIL